MVVVLPQKGSRRIFQQSLLDLIVGLKTRKIIPRWQPHFNPQLNMPSTISRGGSTIPE